MGDNESLNHELLDMGGVFIEIHDLQNRIDEMAGDGNLDVEDLATVLGRAGVFSPLSDVERLVLSSTLTHHRQSLEPAARRLLEDVLAGDEGLPVNRVLLAPHPRGAQRDLYYSVHEVSSLQQALSNLGILTVVDGDYGPSTTASVRQFQQQAGLKPSGVVDSRTLVTLNRALLGGDHPLLDLPPRARIRPDAVVAVLGCGDTKRTAAIQAGLDRLGDHFDVDALKLVADGDFGPKTEAAVRAFQGRAYLPQTGIVDVSTVDALSTALTAVGLEPVEVNAPTGGAGSDAVELHFYPGSKELKVVVLAKDKGVLAKYGMVGGRADQKPDPNNPKVDFSPTPQGRYEVVGVSPHMSGAWPYSYVPYGAPLREADGEVEFCGKDGQWHRATGDDSVFSDRKPAPLSGDEYRDVDGNLPSVWTKNDFGHLRARLLDLKTKTYQSHMIHSGPATEATAAYFAETEKLTDPKQAAYVLRYSHGCEHIHPKDFDELVTRGWLKPGTLFVVHGYDERFDPKDPPDVGQ